MGSFSGLPQGLRLPSRRRSYCQPGRCPPPRMFSSPSQYRISSDMKRPTRAVFVATLVVAFIAVASIASPAIAAERLTLNKGDHIAIVGNTLAERMQHHGWLETLIHARFPQHELVFRNLGYPGDEI